LTKALTPISHLAGKPGGMNCQRQGQPALRSLSSSPAQHWYQRQAGDGDCSDTAAGLSRNQGCEEGEEGEMEKVNMGCQSLGQVGAGQKWQRIHYL